jgi:hypothetical protein
MRGYLKGVNLATFAAGNRRIVAAIKARNTEPGPEPCEHPEHKRPSHAEHCASHPAAKAEQGDVKRPFVMWAWRAGGTAGVLWLFWPLVGAWLPTAVTVSVLLWVLAALVAGQGHVPAAASGEAEKGAASGQAAADDDGEWIDEEPPLQVLLALIRHVANTSDQGTAAHLDDVLTEGQRRGLFGGWEKADLKAHLMEDLGLPVEELKLTFRRRQRVRLGVRLKALPEAVPAPVPAVLQKAV